MAKILSAASNDNYKESMEVAKNFRKQPEFDVDEFVTQFINSRKRSYEMQAYKDIVLQSLDAWYAKQFRTFFSQCKWK